MNKENEDSQFDFERLKVYQKTSDFIDKIFEIYKNLPRDLKYPLGDNLIETQKSPTFKSGMNASNYPDEVAEIIEENFRVYSRVGTSQRNLGLQPEEVH